MLSKARARWGQSIFESFFIRIVQQCVEAGLVDGTKLHLDGSLINANASRDRVVQASPELIAVLKAAYQVEERKLEGHMGAPYYQPVNASLCSTTDPDAPCVRNSKIGAAGDTRPRYKQHRAVDNRCGVITATVTTAADIAEPTQTLPLIEQHEKNTGGTVSTAVGDQQYGTIDNHRTLTQRGIRPHLKTMPGRPRTPGRFPAEDFVYDQAADRYQCPAGQFLYPRGYDPHRNTPSMSPVKVSATRVRSERNAPTPSTAGWWPVIVNTISSSKPAPRPTVPPHGRTIAGIAT